MRIKELIKQDAGFQYVIDSMELMSAAGRRAMLDTVFSTDSAWLEAEWERTEMAIDAVKKYKYKKPYIDLRHCLMCLHDLHGTLASLASHTPLDEVELFEVKNLAQLSRTAMGAIEGLGLAEMIHLPCTDEVFNLLDPDRTGIANFYIYDSYDLRLAPLRRELNALQTSDGDPARISELLAMQNEIQTEVCRHLSDELIRWHDTLTTALEQLAYTDLLLAKAELAISWNLTRPAIGDSIAYKGLVNPRLKQRNESMGLRYQPVDITLKPGVCLITGANSSYASEIIKISNILSDCRQHELLILIDEPARTTNPVEGKALVQAIIKILNTMNSFTLITTHYSQLGADCRRMRVKGFVEDLSDLPLTPQSINRFIDYSLTEDNSDDVPHEALRIATILRCDPEMISLAQKIL